MGAWVATAAVRAIYIQIKLSSRLEWTGKMYIYSSGGEIDVMPANIERKPTFLRRLMIIENY